MNMKLKSDQQVELEVPNKKEIMEEDQAQVPYEILGLLVNYIPNRADRVSFRAVCKLWRVVESDQPLSPAVLPWLMITSSDGTCKFYEICSRRYYANPIPKVDTSARFFGSFADNWVFMCCPGSPQTISLDNICTGEKISLSPYTHLRVDPNPFEECTSPECENVDRAVVSITTTVFSCSPSSEDSLMASVSRLGCFLTICRPKSSDSTATTVHFGGKGLVAIVFYNSVLMGVDNSNTLYSFVVEDNDQGLPQATSFHKHKMKKFVFPVKPTFSNRRANNHLNTYLVEFSGKLLMILRHYGDSLTEETDTVGFTVYELVWNCLMEWVQVTSLPGHTIFLDSCITKVFHASQFPGIKDDHIYFTSGGESFDTGVFSMRERRVSRILPAQEFSGHSGSAWLFPPNCHLGQTKITMD